VLTNADIPQRTLTPQQIQRMGQRLVPQMTSKAVMVVNLHTGQVVYARNEHERLAPASLTKMVTALVAVDHGTQEQEMRVAYGDGRYTYSASGLQNGEPLTLRQLLYLLLVVSDNVAANTIARELGGNVKTYVGWMNDKVAELGLQDTHFANPHGLDDEGHYSSAYDMALIANAFVNDPILADIVNTEDAWVAGRTIKSTNELLGQYPGMVGVKTGTTDNAGECLVTLVEQRGGRVLTVMLGSEDRFREARRLLDYYYANYAELCVDLPATKQNGYFDTDSQWHALTIEAPRVVLIAPWQVGSDTTYRTIIDSSPNPHSGQEVGLLTVQLAGGPLLEEPLYVR
jgi:D-alanyl-D-alanine carboxypeptidase